MSFVYYRDIFGGWRWEFRDARGHLQDSQHSYDTRDECIEAAQAAGLAAGPSGRAGERQASILCVQADPQLRESLQQALASYHTVLASSSLEAIRLISASVFDAYVLDYSLPGSSGIHLCRHIRRTDRHTPICFYTAAVGSEEQRKRAFTAGANAYVCATAGAEALVDDLTRLLEQAEVQSIHARAEEERAIREELERRVVVALDRGERARTVAADAMERAARARAFERFSDSGGTPAHFARWWPQTFAQVSEAHEPSASSSSERSGTEKG